MVLRPRGVVVMTMMSLESLTTQQSGRSWCVACMDKDSMLWFCYLALVSVTVIFMLNFVHCKITAYDIDSKQSLILSYLILSYL